MPHIWFLADLVEVLADGEHTVLEMVAPPGDQPPLHVHNGSDEGFYLLEGEVTFWAGDIERRIGPGEFVLGPKGVPHTYRVTSATPARFIVTSSTGEFAAFVQAYGVPAERPELPQPGAPDVERLGRLAAEHGIDLLGPPGMLPADLSRAA
ncbi:MAG TPA: cupin domain-containing protein [Solirubrobacteraceae bacterium]|nr:cupin domain-containing protein [Solirubrobacteraceae bacterium]